MMMDNNILSFELLMLADSVRQSANRIYAEIQHEDTTEGTDYRLKAEWADLTNTFNKLLSLSRRVSDDD